MTPPPTEEVVREGEEGETEQVQNEELPPQPTPEMINKVLAYLSGLSDQGQAPPVFSAPTPPVSEVQHAAPKPGVLVQKTLEVSGLDQITRKDRQEPD